MFLAHQNTAAWVTFAPEPEGKVFFWGVDHGRVEHFCHDLAVSWVLQVKAGYNRCLTLDLFHNAGGLLRAANHSQEFCAPFSQRLTHNRSGIAALAEIVNLVYQQCPMFAFEQAVNDAVNALILHVWVMRPVDVVPRVKLADGHVLGQPQPNAGVFVKTKG